MLGVLQNTGKRMIYLGIQCVTRKRWKIGIYTGNAWAGTVCQILERKVGEVEGVNRGVVSGDRMREGGF